LSTATPTHDFVGRVGPLTRRSVGTVQINVGKVCNQACLHCHVDAGPKRTERMEPAVAQRIIELLHASPTVHTVDITGGAPELNPSFRELVRAARALDLHVMDRCNLTVLLLDDQRDTAEFLARHQVEIVASLPCYSVENVERQRGRGVFGQSIQALRELNALGYGQPDSGRILSLVYNPGGPFLPPPQRALEDEYRQRLADDFGIVFNQLYTLTNLPIARFRRDLERTGELHRYQQLLAARHNPANVDRVMCRDLISLSWDGRLYDCDFNQMLELPAGSPRSVWQIQCFEDLVADEIALANHCFGCTAGAGSSCGGALDPPSDAALALPLA